MDVLDLLSYGKGNGYRRKLEKFFDGSENLSEEEARRLAEDLREIRKGLHGIVMYHARNPMAPSFLGHLNRYMDGAPVELAKKLRDGEIEKLMTQIKAYEERVERFLTQKRLK